MGCSTNIVGRPTLGDPLRGADMAYFQGNDGDNLLIGTFDKPSGDEMYGLGGNDEIHGRFGDDYVDGGSGNDRIWGDAGNDTLVGGKGNDQFNFAWQMGKDVITDFKVAGVNSGAETDSIQIYDLYSG